MASSWVIRAGLLLLVANMGIGYQRGWAFLACPANEPDDDSFPTDVDEITGLLPTLGRLRLVARDGMDEEMYYSCLTLEFPTNDTYKIRWHKFEDSGDFTDDIRAVFTNPYNTNFTQVLLWSMDEPVFSSRVPHLGRVRLQFTGQDSDFVYARACKVYGLFSGYRVSRYVFIKPHVDYASLDMDCLMSSLEDRYDGVTFKPTGVCADSLAR